VPAQDVATLGNLMNMDRSPVGSLGEIAMAPDGVPEWKAA
jgi:acetyl-CoA C-acetyltransferase